MEVLVPIGIAAFISLLVVSFTVGRYEVLLGIAVVFVVAMSTYGLFFWFPEFQCREVVESQGYESSWGFFKGCQLKYQGHWIAYDKWRVIVE